MGILLKQFDARGGDRKSKEIKSNCSGTFETQTEVNQYTGQNGKNKADQGFPTQTEVAQSIGLSEWQPPRTNLTPYPGADLIFFNCSLHRPP